MLHCFVMKTNPLSVCGFIRKASLENKEKIKKNALFLIDGSYFLYRSYFALPPLHTSKGVSTQAIYAFCRTISNLIKEFDPKYVAVVWDSKGGSKKNKELLETYKATRPKPPSDLFIQKEDILRFISSIKMCSIAKAGYEADDLIGSLAKDNKNHQTVIVCSDKDMYQLLDLENLLIIDTFKKLLVDANSYKIQYGFPPSKIPFYYALLGDSSDNIPGVKGVGKKTALELVKQFKSLDDLYENLDTIEKKRTKILLEEHKKDAFLSFELFTLDYVDLKINIRELSFNKKNWIYAATIFEELELKSLIKELKTMFPEYVEKQQYVQMSIFPEVQKWSYSIISNKTQLEDLIKELKSSSLISIDTETTGLFPLADTLVGISFANNKKTAYYIPLKHPKNKDNAQLDTSVVIELLKPILESKNIKKTFHNAKFDELVFWNCGIKIDGTDFDSLIAANLVREAWQKINLKDLSDYYLNESMKTFKEIMGKLYKNFSQVPVEEASNYAAYDALQTFKLKEIIEKKINKHPKMKKLFKNIEMPLYRVLLKMEKKGMPLDTEQLKIVANGIEKKLYIIKEKIFSSIPQKKIKYSNEPLNLNSPQQVESLLFDYLRLPVIKKTKKGDRSTDHEVLIKLMKEHPIPGLILQYREFFKLLTTYLEPLPKMINPRTRRIHTSFSQTLTNTGRLSSSMPNLQNIPASIDHGIKIRTAFSVPEKSIFLSADYSQIELRVLAHITKDKNLCKAFDEDQDVHIQTASQIFNIPIDKISHDQRQVGKKINFSIIYGATPHGLSRELDISPSEAKEYIKKYLEQYPEVSKWMKKITQEALKSGYVESLWGKRRYVPELREKSKIKQELGRRIAVNSVIQSTAADIIKIVMININNNFEKNNLKAELVLQIHDELIVELPVNELPVVKKIVQKEMETVVRWEISLKVSIREGQNWGEITK
jgi:DNA polymerase I